MIGRSLSQPAPSPSLLALYREQMKGADLTCFYTLTDRPVTNSFAFYASRAFSEVTGGRWHEITSQLYLGQLPMHVFSGQHQQIYETASYKKPLGLVVSAVEYFELASYGVVELPGWSKLNVDHHLLPIKDETATVPTAFLIETVLKMKAYHDQGNSIYVHCRAGKGRSATIALIYLALFGDEPNALQPNADIDQVIATKEKYLKEKRSIVNLHPPQREKAKEVIQAVVKFIQQIKDRENRALNADETHQNFQQILSSYALKLAITQCLSFKQLAIYAYSDKPARAKIQDFFNQILQAKDDQWFYDLTNDRGPMHEFVEVSADKKEKRKELREAFIDELSKVLEKDFALDRSKLEKADQLVECQPKRPGLRVGGM